MALRKLGSVRATPNKNPVRSRAMKEYWRSAEGRKRRAKMQSKMKRVPKNKRFGGKQAKPFIGRGVRADA